MAATLPAEVAFATDQPRADLDFTIDGQRATPSIPNADRGNDAVDLTPT